MHHTASPPRSAGLRVLALGVLAAVLLLALFAAPTFLAGNTFDGNSLTRAVGDGFVEYWNLGVTDLPPKLASAVDYWFRFHIAKAVIAALLLAVTVPLGIRLWTSYSHTGAVGVGGRSAIVVFGVSVTTVAAFSGVVLMANIQGALAPFSSLLSMLPLTGGEGDLGATLSDVRAQLAAGRTSPVIDMMNSDFGWYHAVMAVVAAVVAVTFLCSSALLLRKYVRTDSADRRARRVLGLFGILSVLLMLATGVTALANMGTAADPGPALVGFFDGGLL
ncbi:hypothetical protein ACFRFQ_20090 [Rhodococcus sp. NPDC056743]|uniref:hypothetical protein n=1 Tax=Rhodococcus sp. NPDC056743 TaxID=3345934 RepID=UPI0036713E96